MISRDLTGHRFDTFVDLKNLDSGKFEWEILRQITAREHFIVLLQPGALDRIGEHGDWLRREIAHALAYHRNIVPVTADGFNFSRDFILPPDVASLAEFNAVAIQPGYFDAAMERLRTQFLKKANAPSIADTLARSGELVDVGAPVLPAPQLTGKSLGIAVQLSWSEVPGASEYVLTGGPKGEAYRGPDRSYTEVPGGTSHGTWHYRVRASAPAQVGEWSESVELHTGFG